MPFKNDEQRKAAFARMKDKKGGGGGTKPPTTPGGSGGGNSWNPGTGMFDILNPEGWGNNHPFKPNGPGIPGQPAGSYIGTGGAIYATPGSDWFTAVQGAPNYGQYSGAPGVGPYITPVFEQFQPAETLWGALYLIANGVDPDTGNMIAPQGTPGTLKFGAGTAWTSFQDEQEAAGRLSGTGVYGGFGATLPSQYTGLAPNRNRPRPWWAK